MVDLSSFSNSLKLLYNDKLDVYRHIEVIDNNISNVELSMTPIYTNIPCHISFEKIDTSELEQFTNYSTTHIKIFVDININILKGDVLKATRSINAVYEGICGEPLKFPSHQELILIQIKEEE